MDRELHRAATEPESFQRGRQAVNSDRLYNGIPRASNIPITKAISHHGNKIVVPIVIHYGAIRESSRAVIGKAEDDWPAQRN
jgi:hypothetical protein